MLLDHEEPTPEIWYTVPLHIVENERGNRNLCFRGNFYNMPRGTRDGTVWHCSTRGCKSKVLSSGVDKLRLLPRAHHHERRNATDKIEIKLEPVDL